VRKRLFYLFLAFVAIGVGGVSWRVGLFHPPEPVYGGRRLSEWIESYRVVGLGFFMVTNSRSVETDEAIRHLGTNAVPYLLDWLRYERPSWKRSLERSVRPTVEQLKPSWELTDHKEARAARAMYALIALGPRAEGAIGELVSLLNDPQASTGAARAANILPHLGTAGLPPVLAVLTNQQANADLRNFVAAESQSVQTDRASIPALQQLLQDPDQGMRGFATNTLRTLDPHALEQK